MNVLLTCAGRRNYLVHYFREALAGRGKVLAADASADAPAMQEADMAFPLPRVDDPSYVDMLVDVCRTHSVRLLVSLNDFELSVLACHRSRFLEVGTFPVVSSSQVLSLCADKWEHGRWLRECGIAVPRSWLSIEEARREATPDASLIIKPRWGSGSFALERTGHEEMELVFQLVRLRSRHIPTTFRQANATETVLVQDVVQGQEFGLDIVNDLDGNYVTTFIKRKLAMRAGETDRAIVASHPRIKELGKTIGTALRHVGNLDCDVIENDRGLHVIDLNPRFGGGYPFSHIAGANLPAALLAWAQGETPDPRWLRVTPGVAAAKCDRLVPLASASNKRGKATGP